MTIVDPSVLAAAAALRSRFASAAPFPHVLVEGFFDEPFARELLAQFPSGARRATPNPYGTAGQKAVHSDLAALGGAYGAAHEYFKSPAFTAWVSDATGIDGLLYDESNYGGGTHENFEGRDLRPHVDFNYHPVTKLHRRVNLIVYLNEGWRREWGGAIALHGDPRDPFDEPRVYDPLFNRCIIFETSERSWHGFGLIDLPPEEKHRTRKSISIYLYTRERPEEEAHAEHTTFFVPRPLPPRFAAGVTLSPDDERELGELIGHRDRLIVLYQRELGRRETDSAQAARLRIQVAELQANRAIPLMGFVRSAGGVSGLLPDGWSSTELRFYVRAERPVESLAIRAIVPQGIPEQTILSLDVDGTCRAQTQSSAGLVELRGDARIEPGTIAEIRIASSQTANPKRLGTGPDERDLGFYLDCATFE